VASLGVRVSVHSHSTTCANTDSFEPGNDHASRLGNPLHNLEFKDWWFHGAIDEPPADGEFLEIPSGGTINVELANNKHSTTFSSFPQDPDPLKTTFNTHLGVPNQLGEIKGSAIAIAYKSDVHDIKPEEFVVISTNQSSPYYVHTSYSFPAGLPECPEGGCHCMWGWIHSPVGGGEEMYFTGYRCKVTNFKADAKPLAKPQVARKCPYDRNNCTIGAKQPHYWLQKEGNNNFQDWNDPPYYNWEYRVFVGLQEDIWIEDDFAHLQGRNESEVAPDPRITSTEAFTTKPYTGTLPVATKPPLHQA